MKCDRREFLKWSALLSAASVVGLDLEVPSAFSAETPDRWVKSVCRYCGAGCGLYIGVKGDKVVAVKGDDKNWNRGYLCVKGSYLPKILYAPDRLKYPMVKEKGQWKRISWDEAMNLMVSKFAEAIKKYGPHAVGFYGSGQSFSEESYLANKLFKGALGTNNIDGNPRLCMASAAVGYVTSFGKDEPMGCYDDIYHADCFFIIGSNMSEAHPVIFRLVMEQKKKRNVKIIVADPRKTLTARNADLYLDFIPGTDLFILNAMAHVIIKEKLYNKDFIDKHVVFKKATPDGKIEKVTFEDYIKFIEEYTPELAEQKSGCPKEKIIQAARWFATSKATMSFWCMGINQRTRGVWANNLISNLHLITGQICRPGATPFSLTGQPNACGGIRDVGLLSHLLPYGRLVANEKHREEMENFWGLPKGSIHPKPGPTAVELFSKFAQGEIKCLWIVCTNPGQSLPNLEKYRRGMASEETFLVVSEAYFPSRTSELADLVLPAALWCEKDGTYGQSERRYQYLPQVVKPVGEAKSDFEVILTFARKLLAALGRSEDAKKLFPYKTTEDVWNEMRACSKDTVYNFWGMTRERLIKEHGMLWPVPDENYPAPGTLRRYTAKYGDPLVKKYDPKATDISFYGNPADGNKAVVWLRPAVGPAEPADKDYPFVLTTGRLIEHWHTGTMTMKVPELMRAAPNAFVEMHPDDAKKIGVKTGDKVRLISRRGSIVLPVKVVPIPRPGVVFVPFHYPDKLINTLVTDAFDALSKQPEFKISAVRIERA